MVYADVALFRATVYVGTNNKQSSHDADGVDE